MSDVWILGADGELGASLIEAYGARARGLSGADIDLVGLRKQPAPKIICNALDDDAVAGPMATFGNEVGAEYYHYLFHSVDPDSVMKAHPRARLFRTGQIYSHQPVGELARILEEARTALHLTVSTAELISPAAAQSVAELSVKIASRPQTLETAGVYDLADAGAVSRYDFVREMVAIATRFEMELVGVKFSTASGPAKNSSLDLTKLQTTFNIECPDWRDSLRQTIRRHYETK